MSEETFGGIGFGMVPITGLGTTKPRTFAEIADDLAAYQETLELVEAQLAIAREENSGWLQLKIDRNEIQDHLERIGKELSTKTDACAGVIRRLDADRDEITAEIKRLTAKRKSAEKASDWLKQYIMASMRQNSLTRLKTATNTITIAKNGGKQALTIPHPELVPDELSDFVVKLTHEQWRQVDHALWGSDVPYLEWFEDLCRSGKAPNNEAIRAELEKPCPDCSGDGWHLSEETREAITCLTCQGTRTRKVPGAKLEPRGERLDVR